MTAAKSSFLLLSLLLVLAGQGGCILRLRSNAIQGSGIEETQSRQIEDFQRIQLSGVGDVEVQVGTPTSLEISFDNNLLEMVHTRVVDGELLIETSGHYNSKLPLLVKLTTPSLQQIKLSGVGSMELTGVDNESLEVDVSGVGTLTASGKVKDLRVQLNGTGKANLEELVADSVTVTVSGVGNAKVHATQSVKATSSGVGGITIYGNPPKVDSKSSGVGTIRLAE